MSTMPGSIDRAMPDGDAGQEIADIGTILLAVNLSGRDRPRPPGALEDALVERPVNSIEEACKGLVIEGQYSDADGNQHTASIPVVDGSTFTPDGLTMGDAVLYQEYTRALASRHLMSLDFAGLSDDERDQLRQVVEQLEASINASKEAR